MKLIICGNGFDLHHGFRTSYKAYKDFLLSKYPQSFRDFEDFRYFSLSNSDRWSDLESSLTIDYEEFIYNSINDYYPDWNNDSDSRWYNLDIDIEQQTKFIYNFTGKYFLEWLSDIDYSLAQDKIRSVSPEDLFINFNYTSTLEVVYNVPKENVFHIHGSIESIDKGNIQAWHIPSFNTIEEAEIAEQFQSDEFNNDIVREHIQFGSIYNDPNLIREELITSFEHDDFYSVSIEPAINGLIHFCEAGAKDIEKNYEYLKKFIENKQIDEIIVMGHSILGVDKAYYSDIIVPVFQNCSWSFYCHSKNNCLDAKEFVSQFEIANFKFIKW